MVSRIAQISLLLLPAVLGAPSHGAVHQRAHERRQDATEVQMATVMETVTAGQEPAATAAPVASSAAPAAPAVPTTFATHVSAPSLPSSIPSSIPKPSGGSSASSGKKQGIAYDATSGDLSAYSGLNWAWDWDAQQPSGVHLPGGVEFVPCLKSNDGAHLSQFQAAVSSSTPTAVLGFNEPDQSGIPNAADAVQPFASAMSGLQSKGIKVGTPGVTSSESPGQGLSWMTSFLTACDADSSCKYDFIALHWYALSSQSADQAVQEFNNYVNNEIPQKLGQWINKGVKVWIPEFGWPVGSGKTASDFDTFLSGVMPTLESANHVERYAFYMAGTGADQMASGGQQAVQKYVSN